MGYFLTTKSQAFSATKILQLSTVNCQRYIPLLVQESDFTLRKSLGIRSSNRESFFLSVKPILELKEVYITKNVVWQMLFVPPNELPTAASARVSK